MASQTSFGRWLSARRHLLDLTQDELARRVGCSIITIRKLEADERRPSKQVAERLVQKLGIPAAERAAFLAFAHTEASADVAEVPLPTSAAPPDRPLLLPTPLTALIGREQDLAAVRNQLLRDNTRLLTLIGPPGIGKTRLALAVAAEAQAAFSNGAVFVALAPISDPDLVVATIAQTLDVKESGNQPLLKTLTELLHNRQQLLILDNFEQVLPAAPQVAELLSTCPQVKVLATSRAALHVRGEQLYPVPPLLLPDLAQLPSTNALAQVAAVTLFVERAQAVQPAFRLTNTNAAAVAEICTRLDGLPLAIELVAARVRLLPPQALLARLNDRLALLIDGSRDLPLRQQTLRSAIAWSYDLLNPGEQALFRRLGVFVGGWTLEAAEAVASEVKIDNEEIRNASHNDAILNSQFSIINRLSVLLDQSLLRQKTGPNDEVRFTMLETIREYARERLAASKEHAATHQGHAAYFLALAEAAEPLLRTREQRVWLERLEAEYNNLRATLARSVANDTALGLRLAGALWRFWGIREYLSEGRDWLARILVLTHNSDTLSFIRGRGKALHGAAVLAGRQGDYAEVATVCGESLALSRDLGDKYGMAWSLNELGMVAYRKSDLGQAQALLEESLALYRDLGDKYGIAESLDRLGIVARALGAYEQAMAICQESLLVFRELGDDWGTAIALKSLGSVAWLQGDYMAARTLHEESLALFRMLGDNSGTAFSLKHLGLVAREQGDYVAAATFFGESMALFRALGAQQGTASVLHYLGSVAYLQGDNRRARALLDESLATFHKLGDKGNIPAALINQGHVAQSQGDTGRAMSLYLESLMLCREQAFTPGIVLALAEFAQMAGTTGQPDRAVRLLGAAEALYAAAGMSLAHYDRVEYDHFSAF